MPLVFEYAAASDTILAASARRFDLSQSKNTMNFCGTGGGGGGLLTTGGGGGGAFAGSAAGAGAGPPKA
ncbi:MAG: hypothetical protein FJX59_14145 [Alphaproteobacteria bacterium]|nr:hypothetical protein [Alphaproteobacteria bacterium]